MKKSVNQLIEWFEPQHYSLNVHIRENNRDFSSSLTIYGNKKREFVRLHAKGLEIEYARVNDELCKVVVHENDEIELRPVEKIDRGGDVEFAKNDKWFRDNCTKYNSDTFISLYCNGKIADGSMHGLYPCYYEIDGVKKELLATQFESHHAREMFPCVDEPAAKATFDVVTLTKPNLTVLSNMPVADEHLLGEGENEMKNTFFETTPKMSTYLLALVIGDLQKKTARTKGGVEVNVYATPAQDPESMGFALSAATRSIEFYDDYFGTKYPLPKSDHVALPDFSAGAMENWGLVTYREMALLADKNSAISTRQYVATVIAHELSHMWFGDLVTMRWWNDLWLNESFASLMEHIATDALFPDWDMWSNFETGDVIAALKRDALPGVQSVRQDVHHPDEISTLFDPAIVYAKGERLLKMLRAFIGETAFRDGLREYFKKHAYSNTTADDLWRTLSDSSGKDVAELMTPWLTQPGYPVVFASKIGDQIRLCQQRFFTSSLRAPAKQSSSDDTLYPIMLFANDDNAPKIMTDREVMLMSQKMSHKDPCKTTEKMSHKMSQKTNSFQLNIGNNAHFITAYDDELFADLHGDIANLAVVDRAKILNELLLLVQPGLRPTATILDILSAYADENDNAVWDIMTLAIATIGRFVEPDSVDEKRLKKLTGDLARAQYGRLGLVAKKDESINDQKLRPTIISQMIYAEDRSAIDKALKIYATDKHDLAKIDGDLRPTILTAAVRYGGDDEFAYLLDIYKTSPDANLKQDICSALTSTHDQDQIDEILGLLTRTDIIKPQDSSHWFAYMLGNRRARTKTWAWMRDNWSWIDKTFGGDKSYDTFPRYAGARLSTAIELSEFDEFFADKIDDLSLKRAIEVGHADIAARVEWLDRDREAVLEKLGGTK